MAEEPRSLQLILGLNCNNHCSVCGGAWPFRPQLDTRQALERLRHGFQFGLREVIFSGGEATLRPDLHNLIKAAKDIGYSSILLLTNGRRLSDPAYLEHLSQVGVTGIGTSLYGSAPDIHDRITQDSGSFAQTLSGIKAVRNQLPEVPLSVNFVICAANYDCTADVVRLLVGADIRLVQLTFVVPVGRAKGIFHASDMPRIRDTLPYIQTGIEVFQGWYHSLPHTSITLAFFPFCVLGELVPFSTNFFQVPSYFAAESGELVLIDDEIARQNLKTKRQECALCFYNHQCDGVWQEYIDAKGWAEFSPITGKESDR
jgi:MoaA/NifB/PqqE/SkfB family radical SAM enzyme